MKMSENKPHSIHLRLTEQQYEYCSTASELLGVGVADYIRMIVNSLMVTTDKLADKLGDLKNADNKDNIERELQQ